MKTVLAYDLGGSSLRAALIGTQGQIVTSTSAPLQFIAERPDWSEADPNQWWQTFALVTHEILDRQRAAGVEIKCLVICGMTRTQVFVDAKGQPLRRAITWADSRATKEARRLRNALSEIKEGEAPSAPVNAYHPFARILWVRHHEPEIYRQTRYVLDPKDFLNFRLTAKAAADRISQISVLGKKTGQPAKRLLDEAGLDPDRLPTLAEPGDYLGDVQPRLEAPFDRLENTPVFVGGMDTWCASVGMGCHFDGCGLNVSGTSEVFGVVTAEFYEVDGLITAPWGEGLYHIGGPSQVGADCLNWFVEAFSGKLQNSDVSPLLTELSKAERKSRPIVFLPYLRGERTPLWEPQAKGLFFGINRDHTWIDFLWAVIEGVALANRQVLQLATKSQPDRVREVRIGGGAARSEVWCRVKADVLNHPVVRTGVPEAGLLGAGIVGCCGLGEYSSFAQAESAMVRIEKIFEPGGGPWGWRRDAYDRLYESFLEIQAAAIPLSRSLVNAEHRGLRLA
jgi:xylulokinase